MERGRIIADAEAVLPLIQKHLYPHREVFLRELISNSVDALDKLQIVARSESLSASEIGELRIDVHVDRANRTIAVDDTGVGMTCEEIKKYINNIAVSGAADFLQRYDTAGNMIGCFGIGFYSVFLVAEGVTIRTKSQLPGAQGYVWKNQGDTAYELDACERSKRGTEVVLRVSQRQDEFLELERVKGIVRKYCDFVPYPIYLNGEIVNSIDAPWHASQASLPARVYREFYERLFEGSNECRFWVHLNSDFPVILRGILYVPYRPTEPGGIRLFCNRVFVDEEFREAIPPYLGFLRGVLDIDGLPLNLSREKIRDHAVTKRIRSFIGVAMADRFAEVARARRADFAEMWTAYERALKLAAVENDHWLKSLCTHFLFPSSRGGYTTLEEYSARGEASHPGVVFYLTDLLAQRAYLEQFRIQNREVLYFAGELDLLVLDRIRKLVPDFGEFRRIDFEAEPAQPPREHVPEDEAGQEAFAEFFATFCRGSPVVVTGDETVDFPVFLRRKGRDAQQADVEDLLRRFDKGDFGRSPEEWSVILNRRHPLIRGLLAIHKADPQDPLLLKACDVLYRQSVMKFGVAGEQDQVAFLSQTEDLLTWVCQHHAGSFGNG